MRSPERRVYQVRRDEDDTIACIGYPFLIEKTYRPVLTKKDFYVRFNRGEFGNHGPMWETYHDFRYSGYNGPIAIRTKVRGGRCDYFIDRSNVKSRINAFIRSGYAEQQLHFSAQCPETHKIIQGEVCCLRGVGLYLYFSDSKHPMRQALATSGRHATGLAAVNLLKYSMCGSSYSWLQTLLERYPDHIIEFTSFSFNWGVVPGFNTVFWEVRKY